MKLGPLTVVCLAALLLAACKNLEPTRLGGGYWYPTLAGDLSSDGKTRDPVDRQHGDGVVLEFSVEASGWNALFEFRGVQYPSPYGFPNRDLRPTREEFQPQHLSYLFAGGPRLLGPRREPVAAAGRTAPGGRGTTVPDGPDPFRLDAFVGGRVSVFWLASEENNERGKGLQDWKFHDETPWVDPVVGLRGSWYPLGRVGFRALVEAGGFGISSDHTWRASIAALVKVDDDKWVTAGWEAMAIDHERGSGRSFHLDTRASGPFVGLELWF